MLDLVASSYCCSYGKADKLVIINRCPPVLLKKPPGIVSPLILPVLKIKWKVDDYIKTTEFIAGGMLPKSPMLCRISNKGGVGAYSYH